MSGDPGYILDISFSSYIKCAVFSLSTIKDLLFHMYLGYILILVWALSFFVPLCSCLFSWFQINPTYYKVGRRAKFILLILMARLSKNIVAAVSEYPNIMRFRRSRLGGVRNIRMNVCPLLCWTSFNWEWCNLPIIDSNWALHLMEVWRWHELSLNR